MAIARADIIKKVDMAMKLLEASKDHIASDRLKRADDEIDDAIRILLEVTRDINARKNWIISK